MIKRIMLLLLTMVISACAGGSIHTEVGKGIQIASYKNNSYVNASVFARLPISTHQFIEPRIGVLGKSSTYSIAYGLQSTGRLRVNTSLGAAYLDHVPIELTGHEQFIISTGVDFNLTEKFIMSVTARHFSNGAAIFKHGREPNWGIDSILFGVGVRF